MAIIDIILLVIVISFIISGFSFGLIRSIGSLIGLIAGIYLATNWYIKVAESLQSIFFGNVNLAKILCFLLVVVIVDVAITFVFYVIHKAVNWLPIIGGINKIGGAIIGFLKGALSISILVYIINLFPIWQFLVNQIENSLVAPYLINLVSNLVPFLPQAMDGVKSIL